jgi:hypothetical protein
LDEKIMENIIERIYCAAIWYKDLPTVKYMPTNINVGVVVEGHRHADIIRTMVNLLGKRTCKNGENCAGESIQGFVTNSNRFVGREEAAQIAFDAGQIKQHTITLYSEDLY